jgi:hypothetical protein
MAKKKTTSTEQTADMDSAALPVSEDSVGAEQASKGGPSVPSWPQFLRNATNKEIEARYKAELAGIIGGIQDWHVLVLLDPIESIGSFERDQLHTALTSDSASGKNVLLILLSNGGSIEPAYQVSKLCRAHSKDRFVVAIPRQAKSAATLIAIGADEIHFGPLGQLGPIDPQLGGLPALGVSQALQTIAAMSERHPGSAEMFARYLRMALTVEQIGYCERVSESAVQYAERLLATKPHLVNRAHEIAKSLVYEYKDHGFVIDFEEAKDHLGEEWIKTGTVESQVAELVYGHFDWVNLFLSIHREKRLIAVGSADNPTVLVWDRSP